MTEKETPFIDFNNKNPDIPYPNTDKELSVSLRDQLAMSALNGLIQRIEEGYYIDEYVLAVQSYSIADYMMKVR